MIRTANGSAPIAASARAVVPFVPEKPMARVSFYLNNSMLQGIRKLLFALKRRN
jgi:hypothetical protein